MSQNQRGPYCEELAELVASCDPDDPSPDLVAQVEDHVRRCSSCQAAESALDSRVRTFRDTEPQAVSEEFGRALVDRLCRGSGRKDQA